MRPSSVLQSEIFIHIPSSTTNLGQSELDTPNLTLVAQTVLADNLELRVTMKIELVWDTRHD
jgi:hypothetical protein